MTKTGKAIFSGLVLFFLQVPLFSQLLRFKHITSEEGLSTNFVRAIIQDDRGFMWFGTQDGLNKYDGYQLRIFRNDPAKASYPVSAEITALLQVQPDLILVGTREGLVFFNPFTEKFSAPPSGPGSSLGRITALFEMASGQVLVGGTEGLFLVETASAKSRRISFGATEPQIKCIARVDGMIYIGTAGNGFWKLRNGVPQKLELEVPEHLKIDTAALSSITHIAQYGEKMYLGTNGYGILKVDRSLEIVSQISFRDKNPNADVIRDFSIRNNRIYVASAYGVLVHHLLGAQTDFYTRQESQLSLNSNPCNCIFIDERNNIWVGTDLGGVNIAFARSMKFPLSSHNFELRYANIYAFFHDPQNNTLWLGGLNVFHEINLQSGNTVDHGGFLGNGTVLSIIRQNDQFLWVGTWGNGLFRYDLKKKKAENILGSRLGGTILTLQLADSFLYAGSAADGLFRISLANGDIKRFSETEGLPGSSINSLVTDSKGRVWIGTYDGGLVCLKNRGSGNGLPVERVYTSHGRPGELASNVVFAVNEDAAGNIWAATTSGLSKLRGDGTFVNFTAKNGLASTYLYSILKDSLNNFWMSSNGGLISFDPMKPEKDIVFRTYGTKDGLLNTEHSMGAAFTASGNVMFFGGTKGFNMFRPAAVKNNLNPPPVYITGLKRAGEDVLTDTLITYKKFLELEAGENFFQLELAALDFTDPSRNKFKYKLEGYDREWSAPSTVRYLSYSGLPGGSYRLLVKGANNDGIWNEKPVELFIRVVPPFWKTGPFYFLMGLLGLAAVYGFTHIRTRSVVRENRLLEKKVAQRTRELEEKNRDITSSIEYARRIQEAILPSRDHIFMNFKKVFILYRPKDIVSGDFYWFSEKNGVKIFAVVDCTGHGVPGAFMSMIGHNLLHQIVNEKGITVPAEILRELHRGVQGALRQGHNEVNTHDGMDVSLLAINDARRELRWAGANRPLVLIDRNGNFTKYEGDKLPVGGAQAAADRTFTDHLVRVEVACMAYLFSDGYADQFGGDKGKKFMVKRFHDVLLNIHHFSAAEQQKELEKRFDQWRKQHEQVDDVLIAGIEV